MSGRTSSGFLRDFLWGLLFLSVIFFAELIAILVINSGRFVYTLDDPYIHLALAENIARGHYGINTSEFSAPSSSIIWPFILAVFAALPYFELVPLFLNFIVSAATIALVTDISRRAMSIVRGDKAIWIIPLLVSGLIICTNTIGLIFTGMEHSLQVMLAVLFFYGLIADSESKKHNIVLVLAIVIGPLVRYENLALSLVGVVYLCINRRLSAAVSCTAAIALLMGAFSLMLCRMGLGPFPTSIMAKSILATREESIWALPGKILMNLFGSLAHLRSLPLMAALAAILGTLFSFPLNSKDRLLSGCISVAVILHFLFGSYGAYNRYEIYIWTVALQTILYILGEPVYRFIRSADRKKFMLVLVALLCLMTFFSCFRYMRALFTLPLASNNIFQQHFQMRRFVVDFYRGPVAVNDIGLVSYRNDNYVLDLAGLASVKALRYNQMKNPGNAWMDEMTREKNVRFVMIYESWFDGVPAHWIKIGELHLGKKKITPAQSFVSFFACDSQTCAETKELIRKFVDTLPDGVRFVEL